MSAPRSFLDSATIVLFALALLAPAADQCLRPDKARDCMENELRTPEPRPPLPARLEEVASFPHRYESHYLDTFGLRDVLLRWNGLEHWLGFGVLPASLYELGRENWCFYLRNDSRDVHRGLAPFSAEDLDGWVQRLRERRDYLAAHGARYLFVICPNKQTIYPELTPPTWAPLGPTRLEQLVQRLEREPDLPFLDLRPALRAERAADQPADWVYTPQGSHWNGRGGYAAYAAIVTRLRQDFPGLELLPRTACVRFDPPGKTESVGRQLYIYDKVPMPVYELRPAAGQGFEEVLYSATASGSKRVTQKEIDAPRLLWAHDSFGVSLQPLMCESFAFVQAHGVPEFPVEAVAQTRADLVLETYVERYLATQTPYQPTSLSAAETQFEDLSELLWSAAPDGAFAPVESFGGAGLERREGQLVLRRNGLRDGLLVPALRMSAADTVMLRLSASCAEPTDVDVFLRPVGAAKFLRSNSASVHLAPDVRSVVVRLPFFGSPFEALLRPRPPASELRIDALELRREPAPAR